MTAAVGTPPWHAGVVGAALAALGVGGDGLSSAQARDRLGTFGPNALPATPSQHPLLRFVAHFNDPLIYLLLVAAAAAGLLGHRVDAAVILLVVLVNAVMGFVQEGRAERSLDAIRALVAPLATALHDGRRASVAVRDLVPGDVVMLEAGDRVPADLRLLRVRRMLVDEAMLTGESASAAKHNAPVADDAGLGDRHNMTFSGTLVATGPARASWSRPGRARRSAGSAGSSPPPRGPRRRCCARSSASAPASPGSCSPPPVPCSPSPCSCAASPGRTR